MGSELQVHKGFEHNGERDIETANDLAVDPHDPSLSPSTTSGKEVESIIARQVIRAALQLVRRCRGTNPLHHPPTPPTPLYNAMHLVTRHEQQRESSSEEQLSSERKLLSEWELYWHGITLVGMTQVTVNEAVSCMEGIVGLAKSPVWESLL